MELTTLKAHIKTKQFDPYYIFTGEDCGVQKLYIQQMARVRNSAVKIFDSITDLSAEKHTNTSFGLSSKNALVCVFFDSKEFIQDNRVEAYITQNFASESVLCVFIYTSIDKRTKFYKEHQDKIVEFDHLKPELLIKYVQQKLPLSEMLAKKLIDACECDYSRIMLEVDKIEAYSRSSGLEVNVCAEILFKNGIIYRPPKDAVFDFVDAVLKNKRQLAARLLRESYESGEASLVILTNLFAGAKQLLQVQSYTGSNKLTDVTGLTPFQVKLASSRKGYTRRDRLLTLMELVRNAEKGIKTGALDDAVSVEYVLAQYWS